jgi:hypothetical protein
MPQTALACNMGTSNKVQGVSQPFLSLAIGLDCMHAKK